MAATKRVVDLTKVTEGGSFRPRRKPEGDYKAKIVKVDDHQPKDTAKAQGWVYTIMVEGDARSTYPYYVNPAPKEAWKIGTISAAAGFKIIGKRVNFDPNKLVGKPVGIFLEDDEYEGRLKSTIGDIFPVSEVGNSADVAEDEVYDDEDVVEDEDETVEEEEAPPPPKKRVARKAAPAPEPEEEEYEEEEPEPTPPPRKRARKAAPPPPAEEEYDEDEEVVEDPPAPVRRRAATKAAAPVKRTRPKAPPEPVDDDLDDLDIDELEG